MPSISLLATTDRHVTRVALLFASFAVNAEPLSGRSHDLVDLERLQKGRLLSQLRTPCDQDLVRSLLLVIAFVNNLLDGHFPILKTHQLFLFDFRVTRWGTDL